MNFGLNIAVTGLMSARRGLYTVGHNVDNTATPGFSRQTVFQRATDAQFVPRDGFQGTGTNIYNIERIRDIYLDFKYRAEKPSTNEWEIKNRNLDEVQKTLAEPTDASFRKYLDDFYKSWEDLTKNPGDMSFREPVRENARAFAKHVNEVASRLLKQQKDVLKEAFNAVDQVNSLATQIADLNKQIFMSETDGRMANDLRDRRDMMIDKLAEYVDINATEVDMKTLDGKEVKVMDVSVGGISLVNHIYTSEIKLVPSENDPTLPYPGGPTLDGHEAYVLKWSNDTEVELRSGMTKGLMDLYNGSGENNSFRGIRFYRNKLDEFAYGYVNEFNRQHIIGYTLRDLENTNPSNKGETNIHFFEPLANQHQAALNMKLSDKIEESITNIAAATNEAGDPEDNGNALAIIKQRENIKFFTGGVSEGTPEDFIKSVVSIVGVDKQQSNRFYKTQSLLEHNLDNQRQQVSGVSLNEEMGDMVKFQKVYTAAAKILTTLDQLLDVTVNRLGMVGR
ncbi:MAG: flagellar hook-associated protein FlgK [Tissierellia bacterium]|nr:flagellar hook-associated protein FlgK [Tissierellia bacterium]